MNRPWFFGPFSLNRRFPIVQLLCVILISIPSTVNARQFQGCSLDNVLCDSDEICIPDGLFGQCFAEGSEVVPLVVQKALNDIQVEVLRAQLYRLAQQNLDWPDPKAQCTLAYFKLVTVYELEYDVEFCEVNNPDNIRALVQRVQSILSDNDGVVSDEDLETGRSQARAIVEDQLAIPEVAQEQEVEAVQAVPIDPVAVAELLEAANGVPIIADDPDAIAVETIVEEPISYAEPAFIVDPVNEVAVPVVLVDEGEESFELPENAQTIAVGSGPLEVDTAPENKNSTAEKRNASDLTEATMGAQIATEEDLNKVIDEIIKEAQEEPQKRAPKKQPKLTSEEEKELDTYVHDVLNKREPATKKLSGQQIDKLVDLVESLQDALDHSEPDESSAPEIEEIVPLTSLNNDQQLLLKKDAEKFNYDDMGLANTVHKIVKGDFQRLEGNRVYLRMDKEKVTEGELEKLVEYLDRKIATPNNMYFDDFKYENGQLSFRITRFDSLKKSAEKRVSSASGVAQAVYKRRKDIQSLAGVEVDETGIGSGAETVPVSKSDRDWLFLPVLFVCAFTITTLVSVLAVHLVKNRRRNNYKGNLPEVIDHLESKASSAYEDLCRQRMSTQDAPSAVTIGGAAPVKTGSTSSWPDEALIQSCNLDISTGHVIMSFLKEHIENPGKIADQWQSVSGYTSSNSISTIANEPQNVEKNRDKSIVPYDDNIVSLENGYINASKITDSDPRHCLYVITQAPLQSAVADYWQMVWEQGVALLVNLCQIEEADRYWPEEGTQVYGSFEVNLVSEHIWSEDYVVRSFYLKSLTTNETRTVTQFHYLSWKKGGVPSTNKSLLEFRRKVNKSYRGRASPILVHDFDGSGRAGTYCLIDVVANRIHKGVKEIDIAASLEHLRDQRGFLVANGEQYKMVFSCVAEEVTSMIKSIQH